MLQRILSEPGAVALFGVISICLFIAVFTGALIWALRLNKPFLKSMESLPLQDETPRKGDARHE